MKSLLVDKLQTLCDGKEVLILGLGKEGESTYDTLREIFPDKELHIGDDHAADLRSNPRFSNAKFYTGTESDFDINRFGVILKSPGVPMSAFQLKTLKDMDVLTSQTQIFLELYRDKVIGVTGTKGKSTTTTLIYTLVKNAGKKVVIAGNIGIPFFSIIDEAEREGVDYFVCELSSHQLQFAKASPKYSVLLNLYEDHLDFYDSYLEYQTAKFNILKYQGPDDSAVYFSDNDLIMDRIALFLKGTPYTYTMGAPGVGFAKGCFLKDGDTICYHDGSKYEEIVHVKEVKFLQGNHNVQNMMAATIIGEILGISEDVIRDTIYNFKGLPHRMELIGEFHDIKFYNDSISTIPEATIFSVETLKNVGSLIVGGKDRGVDYSNLIKYLATAPIDNVILIGDVGEKINAALKDHKVSARIFLVHSMEEAVADAYMYTPKGKSCILSPAAASFGMFKNFVERGEMFKKMVIAQSETH